MLGWLPEVRADTVCLVRPLPQARTASGLRFEPQQWGPGVFRLAAPGGRHLLVRRRGEPELAFWLPARLAPRIGEPFGFYLHADVNQAGRLRAAARIARGVGRDLARRPIALRDASRQVAMLYVYDAIQAGTGLHAIGEVLLDRLPAQWRSSSERSDLRRLAEGGEELVAGAYRSLLSPARRRADDA